MMVACRELMIYREMCQNIHYNRYIECRVFLFYRIDELAMEDMKRMLKTWSLWDVHG
jgi:hypothetical protein